MYRVRKTWADAKSQAGAFNNLDNAKACADKNKLNVYDDKGKLIYSGAAKQIYRVRKSWADTKSQVGAYSVLANAEKVCDKYPGYSVYDNKGKAVYTSPTKPDPMQKLFDACLAQAKHMKNYTYNWKKWNPRTIEMSAKYGTCITFVACVLQRLGIIKSGQFIWHDGKGYGNGKVYGAVNDKMTVTYMNNKTLTSLKSQLIGGDIVMVDDNKSGRSGDGGHIFIMSGKWNGNNPYVWHNNSAKSGQKPTTYSGSHKVLARIRIKESALK